MNCADDCGGEKGRDSWRATSVASVRMSSHGEAPRFGKRTTTCSDDSRSRWVVLGVSSMRAKYGRIWEMETRELAEGTKGLIIITIRW